MLHLHPQGQARYPEGGRRREDEPPRGGWRVRANGGDDEHQGDEDLENSSVPGPAAPHPAAYGLSPPLFQPLTAYAARGRIYPAPARGGPRPRVWAISGPLALVMRGLSRSVAEPFPCTPGRYEAHTVQLPKLTAPLPSAGRGSTEITPVETTSCAAVTLGLGAVANESVAGSRAESSS